MWAEERGRPWVRVCPIWAAQLPLSSLSSLSLCPCLSITPRLWGRGSWAVNANMGTVTSQDVSMDPPWVRFPPEQARRCTLSSGQRPLGSPGRAHARGVSPQVGRGPWLCLSPGPVLAWAWNPLDWPGRAASTRRLWAPAPEEPRPVASDSVSHERGRIGFCQRRDLIPAGSSLSRSFACFKNIP